MVQAPAISWDAVSGQADFNVPATGSAEFQQVQAVHSAAGEFWTSGNYTFEYHDIVPYLDSLYVGTGSTKVAVTDGLELVYSQGQPLTVTIKDFTLLSRDDISITLSGGGASVGLSATTLDQYDCIGAICTVKLQLIPSQESSEGKKLIQIKSRLCPSSTLIVTAYFRASTATPNPARVSSLGDKTVAISVTNAPNSVEHPFVDSNVVVDCGSLTAAVQHVTPWSSEETVVTVRSPYVDLPEADSEMSISCQVYRISDSTKNGPTFSWIFIPESAVYIVDQGLLESRAIGNQFGGRALLVEIKGFPTVKVASDFICSFGTRTAKQVHVVKATDAESTVVQVTSPSITQGTQTDTTVRIVSSAQPLISVQFKFKYIECLLTVALADCSASQVHTPKILQVNPTSALITGGSPIVLTIAAIHPDSIAEDVVVVFQQKAERPCAVLRASTDVWFCELIMPSDTSVVASTSIDPFGIAMYTAQNGGRDKSAASSFTFIDPNIPQLVRRQPAQVSTSGALIHVQFDNYCSQHQPSGYNVTFSSTALPGTVLDVAYEAATCSTQLTVQTPIVAEPNQATGKVILDGQQSKTFSFSLDFSTEMAVRASLLMTIVNSRPVIALTILNLRALSTGDLCEASSCVADHNLVVAFGEAPGTLLTSPASCTNGVCGVEIRSDSAMTSAGTVTVTISNYGSLQLAADAASFEMTVFEYSCVSFCSERRKIQDELQLLVDPPTSATCVDKYCKQKPLRNPLITRVVDPAATVQGASCSYNQECSITVTAWQVTAELLTQDLLSTQIYITFGNSLSSKLATNLQLIKQEGDRVKISLLTPLMANPLAGANIYFNGKSENGEPLVAECTACFHFKQVATGALQFSEAYPLTGLAVGGDTICTVKIANFPDSVSAEDVKVSVGPMQVPQLQHFSVSSELIATLVFMVPDHDASCEQNCIEIGSVSIPSLELVAEGFNFTYISRSLPTVDSVYPISGSTSGGELVSIHVQFGGERSDSDCALQAESLLVFWGDAEGVLVASAAKGQDRISSGGSQCVLTVPTAPQPVGPKELKIVRYGSDSNVTIMAPDTFEFLDNNPFVEWLAPAQSTVGANDVFEVHVINQVLPASTSVTDVLICGMFIPATARYKAESATMFSFNTSGCAGEQLLDIRVDSVSIGHTPASIVFTAPSVSVIPDAIITDGYPIQVAIFGLQFDVSAPSDLTVQLESPTRLLVVTSVVPSMRGSWVTFVAEAPAVTAAGEVTMTVAHTLDQLNNQTARFEYTVTPTVHGLIPSNGFTTELTNAAFELRDFYVTNQRALLKCAAGSTELVVASVVVLSAKRMGVVLQFPRQAEAGIVLVACSNGEHPEAGTALFEYTYTLAAPSLSLDQSRGSMSGGTRLTLNVLNIQPFDSVDDVLVTFNSAYRAVESVVYSKAATSTAAAETRLVVVTPAAADGPGEVEIQVASLTESASFTFLYTDDLVTVVRAAGVETSARACPDVEDCQLSAAGGSLLEVTISSFPYTTAGEVQVGYARQSATVVSFEQTTDVSGTLITELLLQFPYAVEPGAHRVDIRAMVGSQQVAYIDIQFAVSIVAERVLFSNSDASEIRIELNTEIGTIRDASVAHNFPCSSVIEFGSVLLGASDECYLSADRLAIVGRMEHVPGQTVQPGSVLILIEGTVKSADGLSVMPSVELIVEQPSTIIVPTAILNAPTTIDLCVSSVNVRGYNSYGAGILQYAWDSNSPLVANILQNQSPEASEVVLSKDQLPPPGESIQICLQVSDFFETSPSVCVTINCVALAVPTIEITIETDANVDEVNLLVGRGDFSACTGPQYLGYRWQMSPAIPAAAGVNFEQKDLQIPKDTLVPNTLYQLQLSAWAIDLPQNIAIAYSSFVTNFPELLCYIRGSSGDASLLQPLVLDASGSFDPANEQVVMDWACRDSTGRQCLDAAGDEIFATTGGDFGISSVAANTFAEGTYTWEATIHAPASNRAKACEVTYEMKAQQVLRLDVAVSADVTLYKPVQTQSGVTVDGLPFDFLANADQKLQVTCSAVVNASQTVTFEWSSNEINVTEVTAIKNVDATNTIHNSSLILAADSISPAQLVSLTCKATSASAQGSSLLAVLGNDIPSGGSCSVSPAVGAKVTTVFKISCVGFTDDTSRNLRYAFAYAGADGTPVQLRAAQTASTFEFIIDEEPGSIAIVARISDPLGAHSIRQTALTLEENNRRSSALTLDDLYETTQGILLDSTYTAQFDDAAMIVLAVSGALADLSATEASGRRDDDGVTEDLLQDMLEALNMSAYSLLASEEDIEVLVQSLSSTISPWVNGSLSAKNQETSLDILEQASEGLTNLLEPTLSDETGALVVSVLEDLLTASPTGSNASQSTIGSQLEVIMDHLATVGSSMLTVGEDPLMFGSGCQSLQLFKTNPYDSQDLQLEGPCSTISINRASLQSTDTDATVTVAVAAFSAFPFAASGDEAFSMISLGVHKSASALASQPLVQQAGSGMNITLHMQDTSSCAGVSWDTNATSWSSSGVQCLGSDNARRSTSGPVTLQVQSTGTFSVQQGIQPITETQAPTPTATTIIDQDDVATTGVDAATEAATEAADGFWELWIVILVSASSFCCLGVCCFFLFFFWRRKKEEDGAQKAEDGVPVNLIDLALKDRPLTHSDISTDPCSTDPISTAGEDSDGSTGTGDLSDPLEQWSDTEVDLSPTAKDADLGVSDDTMLELQMQRTLEQLYDEQLEQWSHSSFGSVGSAADSVKETTWDELGMMMTGANDLDEWNNDNHIEEWSNDSDTEKEWKLRQQQDADLEEWSCSDDSTSRDVGRKLRLPVPEVHISAVAPDTESDSSEYDEIDSDDAIDIPSSAIKLSVAPQNFHTSYDEVDSDDAIDSADITMREECNNQAAFDSPAQQQRLAFDTAQQPSTPNETPTASEWGDQEGPASPNPYYERKLTPRVMTPMRVNTPADTPLRVVTSDTGDQAPASPDPYYEVELTPRGITPVGTPRVKTPEPVEGPATPEAVLALAGAHIPYVDLTTLLKRAGLSHMEEALRNATFDDECLAMLTDELNDDFENGFELLGEVLQHAGLGDGTPECTRATQILIAMATPEASPIKSPKAAASSESVVKEGASHVPELTSIVPPADTCSNEWSDGAVQEWSDDELSESSNPTAPAVVPTSPSRGFEDVKEAASKLMAERFGRR